LQVLGTWDDHDYGLNDAGKELSGKVIAQRLMLDFLDEPEDSKRYALRNTGVNLFSFLCCVVIDLLFVKSIHTKHIGKLFVFYKALLYNLFYILVSTPIFFHYKTAPFARNTTFHQQHSTWGIHLNLDTQTSIYFPFIL
jgi:hypothetical protein